MQVRFRNADNDGVVGALHIPTAAGVITCAGIGDSRTEALSKAAALAERLASDPVLSAVMPPGTLAAIKATKGLAKASASGIRALRGAWRSLRGPGKKRLAEALAQDHGEVGFSWRDAAGAAINPGGYAAAKLAQKLRRKKRRRARPRPREEEYDDDQDQEPEEAIEDVAAYTDNEDVGLDVEGDDLADNGGES